MTKDECQKMKEICSVCSFYRGTGKVGLFYAIYCSFGLDEKTKWTKITNNPVKNCPYILEHTVNNG